MVALAHLANRLDTLPQAVRDASVGIIEHFGLLLLDLNRDYLQKQGERVDGSPISGKGYSAPYAAYKKKYGKFTNTAFVDYKFSGDFLASFKLNHTGNLTFEIEATDEKAGFLNVGGQLLGLRAADIQAFVSQILEPEIKEFVTDYLRK